MGKINWSRVLLGGLLAGLAINVVESISGMVYMDEMKASLEAHGLTMNESVGMIVFWVVYGFVWGIAAIWLYASVRPRFGAGPKTAVITGVGFWFIGYLLPMVGWSSIGLYPASMLTTWTLLGLVEMVIATLLGAWIYKEEESAAA